MKDVEHIQKFNKVFEEYKLTEPEMKQYLIMKRYERISNGYKQFSTLFKKNTDPRTAKYWKAFNDFINAYRGRPIDMDLFFKAQFELKGSGYYPPNFLKAQASWDRYKKYLKKYDVNEKDKKYLDEEKYKAKQLFMSKKFIEDWLKLHNFDITNYLAFFEYRETFDSILPTTFIYITSKKVSRLFCAISKSFGEMYMGLDPDCKNEYMTREEMKDIRQSLLLYPKSIQYAKEKFGEEIDWSW